MGTRLDETKNIIKYGSFRRPLDFIRSYDLEYPFEINHAILPIKSGMPFSILTTENPLTEEQVYRWDLREIK